MTDFTNANAARKANAQYMKVPRPEIAKIIRMRRAGARMVDIINETHRSEHTIRKIFERIPVRQREKIAAKNEKTGQARRPPPKLNPMKSPKFKIHAAYCQAWGIQS